MEKEMCQCRKCNKVFHQSEAATLHSEVSGQMIENKGCPVCKGNYGLMEYHERHSIEGVYKTNKFLNRTYKRNNI